MGNVKASNSGGGGGGGDGAAAGGGGGGGGSTKFAAVLASVMPAATSRSKQTHREPCIKTPPPNRSGASVSYEPVQAATPRVPQHEEQT